MPNTKDTNDMNDTKANKITFSRFLRSCAGFELGAADRKYQFYFVGLVCAWAFSYVVATKVLVSTTSPTTHWIAVGVCSILALAALRSFYVLIGKMDEMIRRIQFERLAIGFGLIIMILAGGGLLAHAGVHVLNGNDYLFFAMLAWGAGNIISILRYQ